jgi:hypothetical protein
MHEDERCCGTGTCILDAQGLCWCGQQWDGLKMCQSAIGNIDTTQTPASQQTEQQLDFE